MTLNNAIIGILLCHFECEAGPLNLNEDWWDLINHVGILRRRDRKTFERLQRAIAYIETTPCQNWGLRADGTVGPCGECERCLLVG